MDHVGTHSNHCAKVSLCPSVTVNVTQGELGVSFRQGNELVCICLFLF